MQIDSLGLPKYGTHDLMDLVYKGKLDTLFKVYAEKNEETTSWWNTDKKSVPIRENGGFEDSIIDFDEI